MRIKEYKEKPIDITELLIKFKEKYRNVYMQTIDDQVYFYRSINRNEYRSLFENDKLSDLDKEDIVCNMCILYPENIDLENCEAGLPSKLYSLIIDNSFLSKDGRNRVMDYYRADMGNVDAQITCIIHEAFQNIDIEEIESWDMEKTLKYVSRAEWILHNIRGVPIDNKDNNRALDSQPDVVVNKDPYKYDLPKTEDTKETEEIKQETTTTHRNTKKTKLTEEKLRELEEKFPDIDWRHDSGNEGIKAFESQETVSQESYALQPRNKFRRKLDPGFNK